MKKILVVDDDEMNLKMAKFILEQKKYYVITVASGVECLKVLKNKKDIDLILLDVEMPIMSGIRTLEHIREHKEFLNIPVMFLTADANEDTVIAAGKLDAVGYVKKPYMPQDFLERVEKVLC